jgi:hypothetical protein
MDNLAERYAELVAKRPELAVKDASGCTLENTAPGCWGWIDVDRVICDLATPEDAAARIFTKLVEALPEAKPLLRLYCGHGWTVATLLDCGSMTISKIDPDPIAALFTFHLSRF